MSDERERVAAELAKEAVICGPFRYSLTRRWSDEPTLCFVMLNPSTADAVQDDPTITRCSTRARNNGFGGIEVVNLFAYRATDPKELTRAADPVGPDNNAYITRAVQRADRVVLAWGRLAKKQAGRERDVLALLKNAEVKPHCLGDWPRHPLYISYAQELIPYAI